MKAAVLHAKGQPLTVEQLPDPIPGPGEVVVQVIAAPVLAYTHEVFSGERDYPFDYLLDILGPMRNTTVTRSGIMALRPGGTAILMGGIDAPLDIPYKYMMRNSLVIRGQYVCPRHAPSLLTAMICSGLINLELFSVQTFPLEQINQAVEYARHHGGPFQLTVLTPSQQ